MTTDSAPKFSIAPNLLDRDFAAVTPNQKLAGDIGYGWTREGWLYLAAILDLHSRRVIGWAVSNPMKRDLAIRALNMAIAFRAPPGAASVTRIVAANIARTTTRNCCAIMGSRCPPLMHGNMHCRGSG